MAARGSMWTSGRGREVRTSGTLLRACGLLAFAQGSLQLNRARRCRTAEKLMQPPGISEPPATSRGTTRSTTWCCTRYAASDIADIATTGGALGWDGRSLLASSDGTSDMAWGGVGTVIWDVGLIHHITCHNQRAPRRPRAAPVHLRRGHRVYPLELMCIGWLRTTCMEMAMPRH